MPDGAITTHPNANEILRLPLPRLTENSFSAGDSMLRVLTDDALFAACGTRIAFTTRAGGVSEGPYAGLNLSYAVGDARAAVDENRRVLCEALGAKNYMQSLVSPLQVHGSDVLMVEDDLDVTRERAGAGADAILCTLRTFPCCSASPTASPWCSSLPMGPLRSSIRVGVAPSPPSPDSACANCKRQLAAQYPRSIATSVRI